MSEKAIIMVGGPDSGKTNYLARVWESIRSKTGSLIASRPPADITFVEEALEHLLKGEFAPRSDPNVAESTHSFAIAVQKAGQPQGAVANIVVPDVTGELWKKALETYEIPRTWMDSLKNASGALLFVREGSEVNEAALDWVTCAALLKLQAPADGSDAKPAASREPTAAAGGAAEAASVQGDASRGGVDAGVAAADTDTQDNHKATIPTQVALCEFLRFLEFGLKKADGGEVPRVAVLVTAWDRLDKVRRVQGPLAYLRSEYPMLAGRLDDIVTLDLRAFGVSVVSGDFSDPKFKEEFFKGKLKDSGYVVMDDKPDEMLPDLTLPLSWVMKI
jgi:hypothetical protein